MTDQAAAPHADPERAFDGQYQLGSEIGAGALGVVYRGVDEKLDKQVAIKVWHARFEEGTSQREQYDTEARALTALEHPNLVAITDYGIAGKAPYLVMELLEGERLDARMRGAPLRSSQAQTLMQSVLRALGYMHMRGVVHRNLKPDNVFLAKSDAGETLKLLDLGLESLPANTNAAVGGGPVLLPSVYDPPEREQGVEPDGRADVYAAGVLMLQMLTGQEPGSAVLSAAGEPGGAETLAGVLPNATPEVRAFIAKAVANERGSRFGNADQMLRALLELFTPWLTGEEEEEPAALGLAAAATAAPSARPKSTPAHAELGASDTLALPAAEGGEGEDAASADEEELELKPFGLVARLRARKKLVLIAAAMAGLGVAGAGAAAFLSGRAESERAAQEASAKKAAAKSQPPVGAAGGHAPEVVLERPYHAEEAEEIQEGEGEPAGQARQSAAGALAAQPSAAALAELHGSPGAQGAPGAQGEHGADAAHALAPVEPGTDSAAKGGDVANGTPEATGQVASKTAEHEPAAATAERSGPFVPFSPFGDTPRPAAAAPGEAAATPAQGEAAPAPASDAKPGAAQAAAAPSGSASAKASAEPGEDGAAIKTAEGSAPPPTAAGEQAQPPPAAQAKKRRTPQELGSERHIDPDQAEIRQMLGLAIKSSPRVAAADPWAIAMPGALQALRDAIARGERGTAGNIKTLRRYNAANPDDVYGHLLLAGFYANRGYALDALDQYDIAYRIDTSSRGAPDMLKHALNMVAQGIAPSEAERFIERVYGREAQAQLSQLLRARDTSAAAASKLRQLQARLTSKRR